jgi:RHS repeat-associated protein
MKKLLLLITFSLLCLFSFTQINIQQDQRVNQILKSALAAKSGYCIYGRTTASRFINIAVLNQASHTLCWFTCHGRLFDSTKLTAREFEQVTSKQLDPFTLYQTICDSYLADMATGRELYRIFGDKQSFDSLNSRYHALFSMETVQAAKTSLQKLIAIENAEKKILTQLAYLNCANPSTLSHDPLYATNKEQAGIMVKTNDCTVYYNIDPTSAVAKISLYKKSAGQFYIQNRSSETIDSVAIQPEKYDLLQKEKTDVFLLYRGWLEMQWQGALSAITRQSAGLYNQVNVQNDKEVKELYNQLNAIGAKINQLNSPEAKSIEQAIYDTYKKETSEISYIPLLGIGYSLTQTRGAKEYELTNHLGNVLTTLSDKKIGVSSATNSALVDHYEPNIVSAQDYYPFGMLQPGRYYFSPNGDKYRYGFNGKENDNEVKGEGNQQDYGMRIYDPRLGRFLSVDPITKQYPWLTPYQFASNRPIDGIDLDGKEWSVSRSGNSVAFTVKIAVYNESNTLSNSRQMQRLISSLESKIESNFTKSFTNADGTTTNYTLNIQFDTKPAVPKNDSKFKLVLRDIEPKSVDETSGTVTYAGGSTTVAKIGINNASQENVLYGTLSVKSGSSSSDDLNVDYSTLIRNLTHEFGHSGGLPHVWDGASPADINQKNMGVAIGATLAAAQMSGASKKDLKSLKKQLISHFSKILKSNLMNSSEATQHPDLRTSDPKSTEVTRGQLESVEKVVTDQQPKPEKKE